MTIIDAQWLRINPETDSSGDTQPAIMARNIRTDSGMVIGRLMLDNLSAQFVVLLYRHGEFVEVKRFDAGTPAGVLHREIERELNVR